MIRQIIRMVIVSLLFAFHAKAFVGGTDLESLCAHSDLIAIVKVSQIHSTNGVQIAEATIEQMLKGNKKVKKIYFLASSTWTCDISRAELGESALVFLNKISDRSKVSGRSWKLPKKGYNPLYQIGHVGRGRMPIYEKDKVKYTEVWVKDIRISQPIKMFPSKRNPQYNFIADLKLNEFIHLIKKEVANPSVGYYEKLRKKRAKLKVPHISVSGAVKSPALFDLREGMTLREAIDLAGGFEDDAESLALYRGGISVTYYIKPCSKFDLNYAPPLQNKDKIKVSRSSL